MKVSRLLCSQGVPPSKGCILPALQHRALQSQTSDRTDLNTPVPMQQHRSVADRKEPSPPVLLKADSERSPRFSFLRSCLPQTVITVDFRRMKVDFRDWNEADVPKRPFARPAEEDPGGFHNPS